MPAVPSASVDVQVGFASVGSVLVRMCPEASVATHSDVDAHEMPCSGSSGEILFSVQVGEAASGSVEMTEFVLPSTLAQKELDGHEIATGPDCIGAEVHAPAPPVGFVDVHACAWSSPVAQNVVVGHDTASRT